MAAEEPQGYLDINIYTISAAVRKDSEEVIRGIS